MESGDAGASLVSEHREQSATLFEVRPRHVELASRGCEPAQATQCHGLLMLVARAPTALESLGEHRNQSVLQVLVIGGREPRLVGRQMGARMHEVIRVAL